MRYMKKDKLLQFLHKNSDIILNVLFYIIVIYVPIIFWINNYYDPFFPTSYYLLLGGEEQKMSKSAVIQHSQFYLKYYPLSLYFLAVVGSVLSIDFHHIGYISSVNFLIVSLVYSLIIKRIIKKSKAVLSPYFLFKFMFIISMITYAHTFVPIYYITLGSTTYILLVLLITDIMLKGSNFNQQTLTSDLIVVLILSILSLFSYYTSSTLTLLTFLCISGIKIIRKLLNNQTVDVNKFVIFTFVVAILYFTYEKVFYSEINRLVISLDELIMFFVLRKISYSPIEYTYSYNPLIELMLRINLYILIFYILSVTVYLVKIIFFNRFKSRYNEINLIDNIVIVMFSFVFSCILQSSIYTFLMKKFFILTRYLFIVPYIVSISIVMNRSVKKIEKTVHYFLLLIFTMINFIVTIYTFYDVKVLSPFTYYIDTNIIRNYLCKFLLLTDQNYPCFSDLKTAFTLPNLCSTSNLVYLPFENSMFQIYNNELNLLIPNKEGLYIYSTRYSYLGIFMPAWIHVKPFLFIELVSKIFDGYIVYLYFYV